MPACLLLNQDQSAYDSFVISTALAPAPDPTFLHTGNTLKDTLSDLTNKLALTSTDILKIERPAIWLPVKTRIEADL